MGRAKRNNTERQLGKKERERREREREKREGEEWRKNLWKKKGSLQRWSTYFGLPSPAADLLNGMRMSNGREVDRFAKWWTDTLARTRPKRTHLHANYLRFFFA
jgi:hypothetical protein